MVFQKWSGSGGVCDGVGVVVRVFCAAGVGASCRFRFSLLPIKLEELGLPYQG